MSMLSLLPDATSRRNLFEQYRQWVLSGKPHPTTNFQSSVSNNRSLQSQTQSPLTLSQIISRQSQSMNNNNNRPTMASILGGRNTNQGSSHRREIHLKQSQGKINDNFKNISRIRQIHNTAQGDWAHGAPSSMKIRPTFQQVGMQGSGSEQIWPALLPPPISKNEELSYHSSTDDDVNDNYSKSKQKRQSQRRQNKKSDNPENRKENNKNSKNNATINSKDVKNNDKDQKEKQKEKQEKQKEEQARKEKQEKQKEEQARKDEQGKKQEEKEKQKTKENAEDQTNKKKTD